MKRTFLLLVAILVVRIASSQFAGAMRGQQAEPLPEGFKPASTNTFLAQYPAVFNSEMKLLFISTGTEERSPKELVETLKKNGIKNIVYHESEGTAHEWLTWRRVLNDFVPRLFK